MPVRQFVDKPSFAGGQASFNYSGDQRNEFFRQGNLEVTNMFVTQRGTLKKRKGLEKFGPELSMEGRPRVFTYKSPRGSHYLIFIVEGSREPLIYKVTDNDLVFVALKEALNRSQKALKGIEESTSTIDDGKDITATGFGNIYNKNSVVPNTKTTGSRVEKQSFGASQVENMFFSTYENIMCFTENTIPPFFILEESDSGFIILNSLDELSHYNNPKQTGEDGLVNTKEFYTRMYESFPYSLSPYTLQIPAVTSTAEDDEAVTDNKTRGWAYTLDVYLGTGKDVLRRQSLTIPNALDPIDYVLNERDKALYEKKFIILDNEVPANTKNEDKKFMFCDMVSQSENSIFPTHTSYIGLQDGEKPEYLLQVKLQSMGFIKDFPEDSGNIKLGYSSDTLGTASRKPKKAQIFISDWDAGDYPRYSTFFEGRLILASTKKSPQKLWFSEIGNFSKFFDFGQYISQAEAINPSSPGSVVLDGPKSFEITSLGSQESLFIGTTKGFYSSRGTDPTSTVPFSHGFINSFEQPLSNQPIINMENFVYFTSSDNKQVGTAGFTRNSQKYAHNFISYQIGDILKNLKIIGADPKNQLSLYLDDDNTALAVTKIPGQNFFSTTLLKFDKTYELLSANHLDTNETTIFYFLAKKDGKVRVCRLDFNFDGSEVYEDYWSVEDRANAIMGEWFLGKVTPFIPSNRVREGDTLGLVSSWSVIKLRVVEAWSFHLENLKSPSKPFSRVRPKQDVNGYLPYINEELEIKNNFTSKSGLGLSIVSEEPYGLELSSMSLEGEVRY